MSEESEGSLSPLAAAAAAAAAAEAEAEAEAAERGVCCGVRA